MIQCCLIFSIYHTSDAILGHISLSVEIYRSSWSCMIISTYEIHIKLMNSFILRWFLSGASFRPFSQTHTFLYLNVFMFLLLRDVFWYVDSIQLWTWITRITHLVMDDLVPSYFSTYHHTSDAILGHISVLVEICRSPLIRMIIPIYEIHVELMICFYFTMIP